MVSETELRVLRGNVSENDGLGVVLTISETDVRETGRSVSGKGGVMGGFGDGSTCFTWKCL